MTKQAESRSEAGFTLIEMLTAVLLAAILAAIIAPGWINFTNNRRAVVARDQVLQLLRQAQSRATQTRQVQTVNFLTPANQPPVVQINGISQVIDAQTGGTGGFNAQMFRLDISANGTTGCSQDATGCIVFNDRGNVVSDSLGDNGIVIAVSSPASSTSTNNKQCVIVKTLLGAMQTGSGKDCQ
jgi:prepilin-type N-terminal cleavage/methylation domain-containing protein